MKIEVNVSKTKAFVIIGVLIVLAGVIGVIATVDKSKSWHSASQVEMASGNSLQGDVDIGVITSYASLSRTLVTKLSGNCMVSVDSNSRPTCQTASVKAPASCTSGGGGTICACPVSYTRVVTGSSVADITQAVAGSAVWYSCYDEL